VLVDREDDDAGRPLGNNLAVRVSTAVVKALDLKEGDDIQVRILNVHELAVSRQPGRLELLKRLHAFRGRLSTD
jgi:antitoxin MazE